MKKCTKKRDARAKSVVVLRNKPTAFLTSWLPLPSSLLKLPNKGQEGQPEKGRRKVLEESQAGDVSSRRVG